MDRDTYWALSAEFDRLYAEAQKKLEALTETRPSDYIDRAAVIGEMGGITRARTVLRIAYEAQAVQS